MNATEQEEYYDTSIAPLLKEAAVRATGAGIPLLCVAEWNPYHVGETWSGFPTNATSLEFAFVALAQKAHGNLDSLVIGILRYCRERGVSTAASIVAHRMLGTPQEPVPRVEGNASEHAT